MPLFETIKGATPVEDDSDLIPTHITTREELNEWEATNILKATHKYLGKRRSLEINIELIKSIHKAMFDQTWEWAGKFRRRNYNMGVDWHKIQEEIKKLADDMKYWQAQNKNVDIFKQSIRLHHRLVLIHPFDNGNGRHARLVSDAFLFCHEHKLPKWPNRELIEETNIREKYILSLQAADKGNYVPLEEFAGRLIK